MKNTLADIIVAISAPVWMKAPRAENICWKNQAMNTTKTRPITASVVSFLPIGDLHR